MSKVIKFGEDVPGYNIPVLNEREIRAAAGMLFLFVFIAVTIIFAKGDFLLMKYAVTFFFVDFLIRVFINPKFSPTLIIGRLIVRNQTPEYVGAQQKKFSWIIGVVLAGTMFFHMVVFNSFSPITGITCLICLIFLFFESVFGICIGCKFYKLFYKQKAQYCPGEVCDLKAKQDIQKTSAAQMLVVLGFALFIFLTVFFFNENFKQRPLDIFGIEKTSQKK